MTFEFKHPSKYKKLSTGAPPKSGPTPPDRDWEN